MVGAQIAEKLWSVSFLLGHPLSNNAVAIAKDTELVLN